MFSWGYCETFKKTYLDKDVQTAASVQNMSKFENLMQTKSRMTWLDNNYKFLKHILNSFCVSIILYFNNFLCSIACIVE